MEQGARFELALQSHDYTNASCSNRYPCIMSVFPDCHHGFLISENRRSFVKTLMVGIAGFEPAVTESKSAALPLGYTPLYPIMYGGLAATASA